MTGKRSRGNAPATKADIEFLGRNVSRVATELDQKITAVDQKITTVDGKVDAVLTKLDGVAGRAEVEEQERKIADAQLERRIEVLEQG